MNSKLELALYSDVNHQYYSKCTLSQAPDVQRKQFMRVEQACEEKNRHTRRAGSIHELAPRNAYIISPHPQKSLPSSATSHPHSVHVGPNIVGGGRRQESWVHRGAVHFRQVTGLHVRRSALGCQRLYFGVHLSTVLLTFFFFMECPC